MKQFRHKLRKWHIWLVLIALVLPTGLYLFRGVLIAPHAIAFLERAISSNLGLRVSIDQLGGTYFSNLEIEHVTTVERMTDGPFTFLKLRRLRLTYHLLDLLKGVPTFLAGASVELEGASLAIGLTRSADTGKTDEPPAGWTLPQRLPQVRIRNTSVRIHGEGFETNFGGITLTVQRQDQTASRIRLRVSEWSWSHADLRDTSIGLDADIIYAGDRVTLTQLVVGKQPLVESAAMDLKAMPDQLSFQARLNLAGGRLETSGRLENSRLQAKLAANDIDLSRMSALLASHVPAFGGILSAQGQLDLPLTTVAEMAADLNLQVADGTVYGTTMDRIAMKFTAENRYWRIADLELVNSANRVVIRRASVPATSVFTGDVNMLLESLEAEWEMQSADVPSLLKLAGVGPEAPTGPVPKHWLILSGRMESGKIFIPDGRLEADGGHVRLESAEVTVPVGDRRLADLPVAGNLVVDLPDLRLLSRIFALPRLGGSVRGQLQVTGTLGGPRGTAAFTAHTVTYRNTNFGDLSVRAAADTQRATVESAVLKRGNDRVLLTGSFRTESRRLDDVNVTVDVGDLSVYNVPWLRGHALVSGSVRGRLQASGDPLEPDAYAEIRIGNLQVNDIHIESIIAQLQSTGRRLNIELAEIQSAAGRLRLVGAIQRDPTDTEFDLQLDEAALTRQDTLLALEQPARVRLTRKGAVDFDNVSLGGSVGRLLVGGQFNPRGESDLSITAAGLRSNGWFDVLASDRIRFEGLDAKLHFSGPLDSPSFAAIGVVGDLGSPDMPMGFSGRFDLNYSDRKLTINEFIWNSGDQQKIRLTGNLPVDPFGPNLLPFGPIAITGRAEITDAKVLDFLLPSYGLTGGPIETDLELAGTWKRPAGKLRLRVHNLNRPQHIKPLPPPPYDVAGDIRIDSDRVMLDQLQITSPGLQVHATGEWSDAPAIVDLFRYETLKLTGQVALEASLDAPDLSWLAREVEAVRRLSGRLEARGTLQGPITAPVANAIIRLSNGELSPNFDMPSLQTLNLEVRAAPKSVRVQSLTGQLGGALFELTGSMSLAGSEADLRLQGKNLLLFRNESLRLRADTNLTLKGALSRLELAGEIAVTDGRFSKNFGVFEGLASAGKPGTGGGFHLFSIKQPPLRDMVFNVQITARNPFLIRNNLARGAVRPDLVLSGTGEAPVLAGRVYVEPTRLYLPAGRMNLESGFVRFEPNDPDRPKLDLFGTASLLGYDITAVIDGPYDEPVVTLSSVPPLPDEDLVLLLLTGQPPKQSGLRDSGRRQEMNVAVFLGRDMISRLFGSESEEAGEYILDRFDVEVGRQVSRRGEETIHAQFRLADNLLRDKDSLYLTGERDYFDYYNLGVKIVFRFR